MKAKGEYIHVKKINCSVNVILCYRGDIGVSAQAVTTNPLEDSNLTHIEDCNDGIALAREIECTESPDGNHRMYARGSGWIYDRSGNRIVNNGYAYQCKYCTTAVVTQYDAVSGSKLGYYVVYDPGYRTAAYGTVITTNNYGYKSNRKLSGFTFEYNQYNG